MERKKRTEIRQSTFSFFRLHLALCWGFSLFGVPVTVIGEEDLHDGLNMEDADAQAQIERTRNGICPQLEQKVGIAMQPEWVPRHHGVIPFFRTIFQASASQD